MNKHMDDALAFGHRLNILLTVLLLLICLAGPRLAKADDTVQVGSEISMVISVCFSKEDAMQVADAMQESQEAANKVFDDNPKCSNAPLHFKVGHVVHVVNLGNVRFVKVVEITDPNGAEGTLYWLTSRQIVLYKVDNNT